MPQSTHRPWAAQEVEQLRALYAPPYDRPLGLTAFANSIGRAKANVCRKARELGLRRDLHRKRVEQRKPDTRWKPLPTFASDDERHAYLSAASKRVLAEKGHPRGALGMKHSQETLAVLSAKSRAGWERARATGTGAMSPEQRQRRSDQMSQRQANDPRLRNGYTRTRGGKREDLGDTYFRSAWEANYARYLNWLVAQGQIKSWRYEPVTFWFEAIKRGVRSWKPDFEVVNLDGSIEYHEVKGWDYPRGRTARQRMAKYHPTVKIVLIDEAAYKEIAKWKRLMPDWE